MIIGLSGYARSGKDEAAKVLMDQYGFERIAFADKLRDFLYALNPDVMEDDIAYGQARSLQEIIDKFGWDGYKSTPWGKNIRGLLQRLGTEAGRETLWDSIWIDAALHDLDPNKNYVITDARFPNEAEAVKERGGRLWRIERADVGPALDENGVAHKSETSLDNYDFDLYLVNNQGIEQYHTLIKNAYLMDARDITKK